MSLNLIEQLAKVKIVMPTGLCNMHSTPFIRFFGHVGQTDMMQVRKPYEHQ
jgi:hypothetical protein